MEESPKRIVIKPDPTFSEHFPESKTIAVNTKLEKSEQDAILGRLETGGYFEGLDLKKLETEAGFDKKEVAALLAEVPRDRQQAVKDALTHYASLRDTFFQDTTNEQNFRKYMECLVTLNYGGNATTAIQQVSSFLDQWQRGDEAIGWVPSEKPLPHQDKSRVFYQLYVDLFAKDFDGLIGRLDYLKEMGVTTLWILPFLESTNYDAGFDVTNPREVQARLGGNTAFQRFLNAAREKGITLMMDRVLNHLSWKSTEFQAAIDPSHSEYDKYKNWFIFRDVAPEYPDKPPDDLPGFIIFENMVSPKDGQEVLDSAGKPKTSNWTLVKPIKKWVYNRFLPHMPDVNFRNPEVLVNELDIMRHWADMGQGVISDFRYDALPLVWKADRHTIDPALLTEFPDLAKLIESFEGDRLPQSRLILNMQRAFAEHRYNGHVRIVPEVAPDETGLKYFGPEGEGATHEFGFIRLRDFISSIVNHDAFLINRALDNEQKIPQGAGTVDMAKHHDNTPLDTQATELLAPKITIPAEISSQLQELFGYKPENGLRFGDGLATSLYDLHRAMNSSNDPQAVLESHKRMMSFLFFTAGQPMVYMGDEFLNPNNPQHLLEVSVATGGLDMRHIHRSLAYTWEEAQRRIADPTTIEHASYHYIKKLAAIRKGHVALIEGDTILVPTITPDGEFNREVAVILKDYEGEAGAEQVLMLTNLSDVPQIARMEGSINSLTLQDLITDTQIPIVSKDEGGQQFIEVALAPKQSIWLK